ncbi:hypothetical protein L195_g044518 [Trifolium pratense]|uniref:Uncharacterized protein n=1 Tax=Trifolium pratense TaxID=57577 RepID=A0A2K3MC97_TRIPR|nr:hypothetical protein L195_g044518 [Trifolium pratense]
MSFVHLNSFDGTSYAKEEKMPHGLVYLRDPSPTDSTEQIENASSSENTTVKIDVVAGISWEMR